MATVSCSSEQGGGQGPSGEDPRKGLYLEAAGGAQKPWDHSMYHLGLSGLCEMGLRAEPKWVLWCPRKSCDPRCQVPQPSPSGGMVDGLGPSQGCVCEAPGQAWEGVGSSGPGIALTPAHPPHRLWWVRGRRALGWASGYPQSWWSLAKWALWRVGSCVGPQRVPRRDPPRAKLLLVSDGLPVGVSRERIQKQGLLPAHSCKQSPPARSDLTHLSAL